VSQTRRPAGFDWAEAGSVAAAAGAGPDVGASEQLVGSVDAGAPRERRAFGAPEPSYGSEASPVRLGWRTRVWGRRADSGC
jgi:hypothetical protein